MGQTETKPETTGLVQYDVTIYTGEKKQNGTDGSAYIQLYGDKVSKPAIIDQILFGPISEEVHDI